MVGHRYTTTLGVAYGLGCSFGGWFVHFLSLTFNLLIEPPLFSLTLRLLLSNWSIYTLQDPKSVRQEMPIKCILVLKPTYKPFLHVWDVNWNPQNTSKYLSYTSQQNNSFLFSFSKKTKQFFFHYSILEYKFLIA